jgi:hypothetical protein
MTCTVGPRGHSHNLALGARDRDQPAITDMPFRARSNPRCELVWRVVRWAGMRACTRYANSPSRRCDCRAGIPIGLVAACRRRVPALEAGAGRRRVDPLASLRRKGRAYYALTRSRPRHGILHRRLDSRSGGGQGLSIAELWFQRVGHEPSRSTDVGRRLRERTERRPRVNARLRLAARTDPAIWLSSSVGLGAPESVIAFAS